MGWRLGLGARVNWASGAEWMRRIAGEGLSRVFF